MDFKQLESFVTIAKLKSFSKAADKLFLTQPTISNHIHLLEKELGTILFNRTNKNITLTRAGDILYEHAISILNKKEHAFFSLNEFKGKIEGILEISSSSIPEQYFLADTIRRFSHKYPDVTYSLMKYDTRQVTEKILSGDIDFGIVGACTDSHLLEYIDIMEDEIAMIVPSSGPLAQLEKVKSTDCAKMPLIMREDGSGTRSAVLKHLEANGLDTDSLRFVAEVESNETIKRFVELGLGVSFLSKRAVEKEVRDGTLKMILLDDQMIKRQFYFVYHRKRVLSPLSDTFKNFILTEKA